MFEAMETSWTIVCVDVVKKWWDMMSSLESDLKELRSLQMTTSSLSEDSRSIRYESNQSIIINTSNFVTAPYPCSSTTGKTFLLNKSRNNFPKCGHLKGERTRRPDYNRRRAHRERSTFNYLAPERYPKYPDGVYKAWKAGLGLYDLLALVHLVPAAWDHAFKPPYYPPLPIPTVLQFGVIELE